MFQDVFKIANALGWWGYRFTHLSKKSVLFNHVENLFNNFQNQAQDCPSFNSSLQCRKKLAILLNIVIYIFNDILKNYVILLFISVIIYERFLKKNNIFCPTLFSLQLFCCNYGEKINKSVFRTPFTCLKGNQIYFNLVLHYNTFKGTF